MNPEDRNAASQGRPLLSLGLILIVPLVVGALLAPQAYRLLGWLSQYVNLGPHFTDPRFKRVLSRCVMIAAAAMLYPAFRLSGFRSMASLGWRPQSGGRWRQVALWFAIGAISTGTAYLLSDAAGALYFRPRSTDLARALVKWTTLLVGSLLIGAFEETFFRGYLFGALRAKMKLPWATVLAALLFALVHFARPVEPAGLDPTHWAAGFRLLPHIADGVQGQYFWPMLVNLSLIGVVLCLLYDHFGALYAVIGLHAGWVWMQGVGTYLFDRNGTRLWTLFGNSETLSMTWTGTMMLAVFVAAAVALRASEGRT